MSNKSPKIDPEKKKKMALQAKGLLKKLEKNKQHYAILERLAVDLRGQNLSEFGIENVDNAFWSRRRQSLESLDDGKPERQLPSRPRIIRRDGPWTGDARRTRRAEEFLHCVRAFQDRLLPLQWTNFFPQ